MTQEDKQLLLKDLCDRLLYGVIYHRNDGANIELREIDIKNGTLNYTDNIVVRECKPYLRPMSSIAMKEQREYISVGRRVSPDNPSVLSDWLNAHHFDYRGLIEMGLALEAPEGMYKIELL